MLKIKLPGQSWTLRSIDVLSAAGSNWNKTQAERAEMTLACQDTDYLPKVKDAGKTKTVDGVKVQVMHNGLVVKKNGYQGEWQAKTIEELKGNHEPQEEKVFFEVIKRLNQGDSSMRHTMIELGSWWSYYSLWFLKEVNNSQAICEEPDPVNIELGKANAKLNSFKVGTDILFYEAAAGSKNGQTVEFDTEDKRTIRVPVRTVDSLVEENEIEMLDILHMDIQGAEMDTLKGTIKTIKEKKIRFLFVSTHHYAISGDPIMHQKCLEFIKINGGHIISSHTILESCSGDGLIVASFSENDKDFKVAVTLQPTDDSLFRAAEIDTAILWEAHNKTVEEFSKLDHELRFYKSKVADLETIQSDLQKEINGWRYMPVGQRTKLVAKQVAGGVKRRLTKD